jgi:hypothetical protein
LDNGTIPSFNFPKNNLKYVEEKYKMFLDKKVLVVFNSLSIEGVQGMRSEILVAMMMLNHMWGC